MAWYVALGPWVHHSLLKYDPRLTLTYFKARSNLVFYAFIFKKLLESHLMEETYSKWPEWQKVYVYVKILTPRGCLPMPQGYIHVYKHEKLCIRSGFKDIFLKLAINGQSDKAFLLTSRFCPQGVFWLCPGAIYMYKIIKMCIKSGFEEIILKHATNRQREKAFLLLLKFCPHWIVCPCLELYTYSETWKNSRGYIHVENLKMRV